MKTPEGALGRRFKLPPPPLLRHLCGESSPLRHPWGLLRWVGGCTGCTVGLAPAQHAICAAWGRGGRRARRVSPTRACAVPCRQAATRPSPCGGRRRSSAPGCSERAGGVGNHGSSGLKNPRPGPCRWKPGAAHGHQVRRPGSTAKRSVWPCCRRRVEAAQELVGRAGIVGALRRASAAAVVKGQAVQPEQKRAAVGVQVLFSHPHATNRASAAAGNTARRARTWCGKRVFILSIFLTEGSTPRRDRRVLAATLGHHHKPFGSAGIARGPRALDLVGVAPRIVACGVP